MRFYITLNESGELYIDNDELQYWMEDFGLDGPPTPENFANQMMKHLNNGQHASDVMDLEDIMDIKYYDGVEIKVIE